MFKLVLLRHGESTWNKENRFTGWTDVDLSDKGREEARHTRGAAWLSAHDSRLPPAEPGVKKATDAQPITNRLTRKRAKMTCG